MRLHKSPMTIYFESRVRWGLPVYFQNNLKVIKSEVLLRNVTKYILCGVNCVDFILLHVMHCNAHRSPMTIYFKSLVRWVSPFFFQNNLKVLKSKVLLRQCNQIYSMWSKLSRFHLFTCKSL